MRLSVLVLFMSLVALAARAAEPISPQTRFATSKDGTRIAYEVTGSGPVVVLLHGGGQSRRIWHEAGYASKLAKEFTIVCVDLRGHGDSDKPTASASYAVDRLVEDVLAVADAAKAPRFALWGFSYGANIGRYVAVRSDRVRSMVYVGIPFGPAASGAFKDMIVGMRAKWTPLIATHRAGRLDTGSLAPADREAWEGDTVPVRLAWLSAMLDYPTVEPAQMPCPTLWVVGTANADTMASVAEYKDRLAGTRVSLALLDGLTHRQELERRDQLLPRGQDFTRATTLP